MGSIFLPWNSRSLTADLASTKNKTRLSSPEFGSRLICDDPVPLVGPGRDSCKASWWPWSFQMSQIWKKSCFHHHSHQPWVPSRKNDHWERKLIFPTALGWDMDVSENSGTPKSSILIGFSIINHPFWDTSIFGNTHMLVPRIAIFLPSISNNVARSTEFSTGQRSPFGTNFHRARWHQISQTAAQR